MEVAILQSLSRIPWRRQCESTLTPNEMIPFESKMPSNRLGCRWVELGISRRSIQLAFRGGESWQPLR
jgi:hypothetical protein